MVTVDGHIDVTSTVWLPPSSTEAKYSLLTMFSHMFVLMIWFFSSCHIYKAKTSYYEVKLKVLTLSLELQGSKHLLTRQTFKETNIDSCSLTWRSSNIKKLGSNNISFKTVNKKCIKKRTDKWSSSGTLISSVQMVSYFQQLRTSFPPSFIFYVGLCVCL